MLYIGVYVDDTILAGRTEKQETKEIYQRNLTSKLGELKYIFPWNEGDPKKRKQVFVDWATSLY